MRSDAEQAARMMGLDFKVDAILNGHAEICNLFAGDFEAEERQAAAYAAGHYAAKFVPDWVYTLGTLFFNGTISAVVFFFVNKRIFPQA